MNRGTPIRADLVLIGGGHAHVHVIKAFAMRPEPGVRLTLITRDLETPYSGMLPGVVAGIYRPEEAHIDLMRLCAVTGTRLIHAEASGLDRAAKRVRLADRPPLAYDLVSLDVGITPALDRIEGAAAHGIAVKPIGSFLDKFAALLERCRAADGPRRIVLIGGGAGGVELILSIRARLLAEIGGAAFSFTLVTAGGLLEGHNDAVRDSFRRSLAARGIAVQEHRAARAVTAQAVALEDGTRIEADAVLITTDAAAPAWFRETGLALDPGGFLAVGPTLQSANDPDVFGAGDCVALTASPRPKSGVYAVRAGPPLSRNLRHRLRGAAPQDWHPQRRHLALISTGERYAVASRGGFKAEGAWLWRLKDWIDRRWMRMYQDPAPMLRRMQAVPPPPVSPEAMRCGGCAAKVGPGPLSRALARLDPPLTEGVVVGLDAPDDAAVLAAPATGHLVQTVDFFRAFIDDPHLFGEIAANHALNDVFAMGATPRYALATAVLPEGAPAKVEEDLYQLVSGARRCLDREHVALVGGHSSEGAELAVGFAVTGTIEPDRVIRKGGLRQGDALVLTRPIGTGILFAGLMRGRVASSSIAAALAEMRRSNREAAAILAAQATAMTDVSGFGLAGHLGEMLAASGAVAELDLASVPLYAGALAAAREGLASTLLPANLALASIIRGTLDDHSKALLFDPQTAGGLLAGIPAARAEDCIAALRAAGYAQAAVIGQVQEVGVPSPEVAIVPKGDFGKSSEAGGENWRPREDSNLRPTV